MSGGTIHKIEEDLVPVWDWPLFMRWLEVWPADPSSRPVGPTKSGLALTTASRAAGLSTPTGRVPPPTLQ